MVLSRKRKTGERPMDSVGRVPEQEPCALFLVFGGKGGEGSRGGRWWSSYILFLLSTQKHHLLPCFSLLLPLLLDLSLLLTVMKGCCCLCQEGPPWLSSSVTLFSFFCDFCLFVVSFVDFNLVFLV